MRTVRFAAKEERTYNIPAADEGVKQSAIGSLASASRKEILKRNEHDEPEEAPKVQKQDQKAVEFHFLPASEKQLKRISGEEKNFETQKKYSKAASALTSAKPSSGTTSKASPTPKAFAGSNVAGVPKAGPTLKDLKSMTAPAETSDRPDTPEQKSGPAMAKGLGAFQKAGRLVKMGLGGMLVKKNVDILGSKPTPTMHKIDFGSLLRNPQTRKDPEVMRLFWEMMKRRIFDKYKTLERAFRTIDTSGDRNMSYLEFAVLLSNLGIQLDARAGRAAFDHAASNKQNVGFDEFRQVLMESTIRKLRKAIRNFDSNRRRIKGHIAIFLETLTFSSSENRLRSVDQFQRKITVEYCQSFWKALKAHTTKHRVNEIDKNVFVNTALAAPGSVFQAYEVDFLLRIFKRVDRRRVHRVSIFDIATALVLLSGDADRQSKLLFLFDVYDADDDGCLLHDQILTMLCCICVHRPIVENDDMTYEANLAFHDEQPLQEGKRIFEEVINNLARHGELDGDILSWSEFWGTFERMPEVLNALIPGTFYIRWTLPEFTDTDKEALELGNVVRAATATPPKPGSPTGAMSPTAALLQKAPSRREISTPPTSRQPYSPPGTAGSNASHGATPASAGGTYDNRGRYLPAPKSPASFITEAERFRRGVTKRYRHAMRGEWTKLESTPVEPASEGAEKEFRNVYAKDRPTSASEVDLTKGSWSDMHRLTLLDWVRSTQESAFFGPLGPPNASGLNDAATLYNSRKSVAVGGKSGSMKSRMSRAISAPAVGTRSQRQFRKEESSGSDGRHMARPQSQGSSTASGKRDAEGRRPQTEGGPRRFTMPEMPETVPVQHWGNEAHDRFRLYNTLRCQENEDRLRAEQARAVKDARNNYAYTLPYACQLCQDRKSVV